MTDAILGPPISTWQTVKTNLIAMGASAVGIDVVAPLIWDIATDRGVNPEGAIAQSYKETGGWHFPGNVQPWFYNPAGIKVRHDNLVMMVLDTANADHPLVHQQFPNWRVGVTAFIQRLLDYCLIEVPDDELTVDPRHGYGDRGIMLWSELGGRWANDPNYGHSVLDIRRRLIAS